MSPQVVWIHCDGACDPTIVGGKAAGLFALARLGFPTPRGVCVTVWGLHEQLRSACDESELARLEARLSVGGTGPELRRLVVESPLPEVVENALGSALDELQRQDRHAGLLAVRSSAVGEDGRGTSFAGLHDTVLGVRHGDASQALRKCWASLWSERAIAYRRHRGLPQGTRDMGVVIQPLVPAEASTVAFTLNPVTGDRSELMITAVHGLGEPLVSGAVAPDTFVVDKRTREVRSVERGGQDFMMCVVRDEGTHRISEAPERLALSPRLLGDLADRCIELEEAFSHPVDVEAAVVDGEWCFLQARPITAGVA